MTLTEKLLGYLNRVFDKGPDSVLALRLHYDGAMTWRVSAGVLTTAVTGGTGGPLTVALSGFSMSGLAAYLAAQPGYSVPFAVTGDMASRSALALIEASGNPVQSNGDHLLAFQSVLWAYMNAQSGELSTAQVAISEALLQIAALTASDTWVDEHGSYYGVSRTSGEADAAYVARIVSEITRARGNGVAIAEAVKLGATASYVTVTDHPTVTVSGGGVGSYGLFDMDVEVPVESVLSQPQIEANTLAVLEAMRDAGTHLRKLRYIRTTTSRLWTGGYIKSGHYLTLGFDRYPFLFDGVFSYDGSHLYDAFIPPPVGLIGAALLHMDGDLANSIEPSTTYTGGPSISFATPAKFSGLAMAGSSVNSSLPVTIGVDALTIEGQFRVVDAMPLGSFGGFELAGSNDMIYRVSVHDGNGDVGNRDGAGVGANPNKVVFSTVDVSTMTWTTRIVSGAVIVSGVYSHVELDRDSSGSWFLFVDGSLVGSYSPGIEDLGDCDITCIAKGGDVVSSTNSLADEFRFIPGTAMHSSSFTPPVAPY